MTQERFLDHLAGMQERGLLRRVAAILYHRRAGFSANGMGVWKVPEEQILDIGRRMAAVRGISHCYQRPTYEDWPYSVFTMAHGRSKEECDAVLDAIAEQTGIQRARDALLLDRVQEDPPAVLHRGIQATGSASTPERARPRAPAAARGSPVPPHPTVPSREPEAGALTGVNRRGRRNRRRNQQRRRGRARRRAAGPRGSRSGSFLRFFASSRSLSRCSFSLIRSSSTMRSSLAFSLALTRNSLSFHRFGADRGGVFLFDFLARPFPSPSSFSRTSCSASSQASCSLASASSALSSLFEASFPWPFREPLRLVLWPFPWLFPFFRRSSASRLRSVPVPWR